MYTPYAIHGLDETLGWRRSWLPAACFLGGASGAGLAMWFQYWTTASDWPLNVGGRPWNSLPAFVPVVFESMVLLAGFTLVFAFFCRCRLYPGKQARLPLEGLTDNRFAVIFCDPRHSARPDDARTLLRDWHVTGLEERDEEQPT